MIEEYTVPETKVVEKVKFVVDINLILLWFLGIVVVGATVFGIGCAIAATNTEAYTKISEDCFAIVYKDNYAFGEDKDYSGTYCKEK